MTRFLQIISYSLILTSLFFPTIWIVSSEPSASRLAKMAYMDSIVTSDSLRTINLKIDFDRNASVYQNYLKNKIDSICKAARIDVCPSIYCWTYNDLTGLGLIKNLSDSSGLWILPFLYFLWVIISLFAKLFFNNFSINRHVYLIGIAIIALMTVFVIVAFTFSIIFYACSALLMYIEINNYKKEESCLTK
jgi:hypothetical protein